ncbi:TlpA family protein disulfide reductase [Alistipes sp. OttesenSCG-928-B03]|nr:TlpA family protein disulfide reductase [Alistipes sp. OttesenSCG-928-B03]
MKRIFLFAVMCLFGATAYAQDGSQPFRFSPENPVGGADVTITYNNSLTPLAASKTITGVIYICDIYDDWLAEDLDLKLKDGVWTATLAMPENASFFVCKFYGEDGTSDTGSSALNSYGMFVVNMVPARGMDELVPQRKTGIWMNRGLLYSKSLDKFAIPGYLPDDYKIDDRETAQGLRMAMASDPANAEKMIYYLALLQNSFDPDGLRETLPEAIESLVAYPEIKELSLIRAAEMARTILKDEDKAKQIEAVVLERFPDGLLARDGAIRAIFTEKDHAKAFDMLEEFVVRFPPHNFTKPQTAADEIFYYRLYWTVLRELPDKKYNVEVLKKYLPLMTAGDVGETYYRGIFLPYDKGLKTAAELRPYAEVIYAELVKRINGGQDLFHYSAKDKRFSPKQWRDMMLYNDGKHILTHARILMETGSPVEALEALEPMKPVLEGKISDYNDTYAQLLALNGYDHLVVPFIEESIRVDAATPEMLETLRTDFLKKNPKGDFNTYLDNLRSDEYVAHMQEKLLAQLVREKVDLPTMESIRGGMTDLEKLKGKVIFLDFWATWCGPCMAAMPGVKMAMDRYAGNTDVAFYFVNTMERGGDPREYVPQVMEMKGYQDFNVLYDLGGKGYGAFSKKFNMSGIPQKVIIDQEGYVRWVSGGYFGNPLELANEISFIVDYLLNEKK